MEYFQILSLIFGAILLIVILFCYIYNQNYLKYSNLILPILKALLEVIKAVGGLPGLNKTILKNISIILQAAIEAAGHAEKLWISGEIDKAARPQYAKDYVKNLLTQAGIEITENITTIINGAIALTCYLMPHYSNKNLTE